MTTTNQSRTRICKQLSRIFSLYQFLASEPDEWRMVIELNHIQMKQFGVKSQTTNRDLDVLMRLELIKKRHIRFEGVRHVEYRIARRPPQDLASKLLPTAKCRDDADNPCTESN